jgi:hypothetical protein
MSSLEQKRFMVLTDINTNEVSTYENALKLAEAKATASPETKFFLVEVKKSVEFKPTMVYNDMWHVPAQLISLRK